MSSSPDGSIQFVFYELKNLFPSPKQIFFFVIFVVFKSKHQNRNKEEYL